MIDIFEWITPVCLAVDQKETESQDEFQHDERQTGTNKPSGVRQVIYTVLASPDLQLRQWQEGGREVGGSQQNTTSSSSARTDNYTLVCSLKM